MNSKPSPEQPTPTFGTHTFGALNCARMELAVDANEVWPLLFDRAHWMPSFVGKERLDGPADAVGERALYTSRDSSGQLHTRVDEIICLEPQRRLVFRLALLEEGATTAFADWRLVPTAAGCTLELSVFWLDLPEPGMNWTDVQTLRQSYVTATQTVIEGHLEGIRDAIAKY